MTELEIDHFLMWLIRHANCHAPRELPGGRWAAICPFAFTVAIITGRLGDHHSIEDRWCYENTEDALSALLRWDGAEEPTGWHRHPMSGRRVSRQADEVDENGTEVGAVGAMYRRL